MDEKTIGQTINALIVFILIIGFAIGLLELSAWVLPNLDDFTEKGTFELVSIEEYQSARYKRGSQTNWIVYYISEDSVKKFKFGYNDMPEVEISNTDTPLVVIGEKIDILGRKTEVYKIRVSKEWLKKNSTNDLYEISKSNRDMVEK